MRFKALTCRFESLTSKEHLILAASHTPTSKSFLFFGSSGLCLAERLFRINSIFHDWVLENTNSPVPPAKSSALSPFQNDLVKAGYIPDDDTDEEYFT